MESVSELTVNLSTVTSCWVDGARSADGKHDLLDSESSDRTAIIIYVVFILSYIFIVNVYWSMIGSITKYKSLGQQIYLSIFNFTCLELLVSTCIMLPSKAMKLFPGGVHKIPLFCLACFLCEFLKTITPSFLIYFMAAHIEFYQQAVLCKRLLFILACAWIGINVLFILLICFFAVEFPTTDGRVWCSLAACSPILRNLLNSAAIHISETTQAFLPFILTMIVAAILCPLLIIKICCNLQKFLTEQDPPTKDKAESSTSKHKALSCLFWISPCVFHKPKEVSTKNNPKIYTCESFSDEYTKEGLYLKPSAKHEGLAYIRWFFNRYFRPSSLGLDTKTYAIALSAAILFVLLSLPLFIMELVANYFDPSLFDSTLLAVGEILFMIKSLAVNPVLYILLPRVYIIPKPLNIPRRNQRVNNSTV